MIKTLFSLATVVSANIVELGIPYEYAVEKLQADPFRANPAENFAYLHNSPIKSYKVRGENNVGINKVEVTWFDGSKEGYGTDEGSENWYVELEEGDCFTSYTTYSTYIVKLGSRQGKEFTIPPPPDIAAAPWYDLKTHESNDACFVGFSYLLKPDAKGVKRPLWMSFAYDTKMRPKKEPTSPVEQEPDSGPIIAIAVSVPVVLLSCLIVVAVLYMHMSRAKNEEQDKVSMVTNPG